MTNCKPDPLARIALRGAVPRELLRLLPQVNIDPFGAGGLDADLVAGFARGARGGWSVSLRTGGAAMTTDSGFACDNAYVAATFLLSRALGLRDPFLAATEDSFATLRQAIALARGSDDILIEGEAGVGKRSLAILVNRASGIGELERVDCAAPEEVAREFAALAGGRLEDGQQRPRTVLLDRLAELPAAHQIALARQIATRPRGVRYLATAKVSSVAKASGASIAPGLRNLFTGTLRLRPLVRRSVDLTILARHFLRTANPLLQLDSSALDALRDYRFPGNVRELHSLMTRLEIYETAEYVRTIDAVRVLRQLDPVPAIGPEAAAYTPAVQVRRGQRCHLRLVRPSMAKAQMETTPSLPHATTR